MSSPSDTNVNSATTGVVSSSTNDNTTTTTSRRRRDPPAFVLPSPYNGENSSDDDSSATPKPAMKGNVHDKDVGNEKVLSSRVPKEEKLAGTPPEPQQLRVSHNNNKHRNELAEVRRLAKDWDDDDRRIKQHSRNKKTDGLSPLPAAVRQQAIAAVTPKENQATQPHNTPTGGVLQYVSESLIDYKVNGVDYGNDPSLETVATVDDIEAAHPWRRSPPIMMDPPITTSSSATPHAIPVAQHEQYDDDCFIVSAELITGDQLNRSSNQESAPPTKETTRKVTMPKVTPKETTPPPQETTFTENAPSLGGRLAREATRGNFICFAIYFVAILFGVGVFLMHRRLQW